MRSAAPAGSISTLIASVRALGGRFLTLVTLEGKQAGLSLAWMLGLALAAAVLAITGWLALLACFVLSIAALVSFVGAGGLVLLVIQQSRYLLFPATRRQLRRIRGAANQHE